MQKEAMEEANTCIRSCCRSSKIPLHLHPSSFSLLSPIARGSESVVYEGRLEDAKVAVKKPFLSTSHDLDRFHQELQLLCKLEHPALATLVAAHARPPNYMFFFRFYQGGNLSEKLHVEEWNPGVHQVLEIAIMLAKSLQYLHNLGIVHRDVKPANILLDENLQPHLADFGLAAYEEDLVNVSAENWRSSGKPTGGFHKKNMVGTIIYMAPEILRNGLHTKKSDAYSFFITINELLTGVVPYTDLRAEAQAHTVLEMSYTEQQLTAAVVSQGLRPVLAGPQSGAPSSLLALIQRGWDGNPQNRPSFNETVEELTSIMKDISKLKKEGRTTGKPSSLSDQYSPDINNPPVYQEDINWFNQGEKSAKQSSLTGKPGLNIWLGSLSDLSPYSPTLSWGSFATCGRRETMEDTHFMLPQMCNVKDIHVFGIFDGHRGSAAAEFSAQALPGFLQSLVSISSPSDALSEAFLKTDIAFRKELSSHRNSRVIHKDGHPGCTAIAALIVRNKLFVANAGDCRTILCRCGHPYALSKDHVASCPKERARITEAGGLVKWQVDAWRVGAAALQVHHMIKSFAWKVTRSIGDDDVKPAVTAEPEITETLLSIDDEYLVMASDGLWDAVSNEEVVSIIKDTVKEPGMCSKRLATEAVERGSKDNVTVIVVFLRPVSTAERIY